MACPVGRSRIGRPWPRAFIAKAVFDVPTTRALIERLEADKTLRHLCGWTWRGEIPSEATFSRAFAEFSEGGVARTGA